MRGRKRHRKKADTVRHKKLRDRRRAAEIKRELAAIDNPVVRMYTADMLYGAEQLKVFERALIRRHGRNWKKYVPRGRSIEEPICFGAAS